MKSFLRSFSFLLLIKEGFLSFKSDSMCTKYWLTAKSSLPRKKRMVRRTDRPDMTIAVDRDVMYQTKPNTDKVLP